jgi:hypothetical protein
MIRSMRGSDEVARYVRGCDVVSSYAMRMS